MASKGKERSWRQLSTREMSYSSQKRIAAFLDSPNSLNWKDLLAMMPEYGPSQMQQLSNQEMRGKSPTISLLNHMATTGRTVGELYDFSQQLGMKRICELIIQGLKDRNIKVDDVPPFPSSGNNGRTQSHVPSLYSSRTSTNECHVIVERPLRREKTQETTVPNITSISSTNNCQLKEHPQAPSHPVNHSVNHSEEHSNKIVPLPSITSSSSSSNHVSSPLPSAPVLLESSGPPLLLSYDTVKETTGHFDEVLYSNGGHMLGKGGFGIVYYANMTQVEGINRDVAVKVFSQETDSEISLQFKTELHTISRLKHPNLLPLLGYSCNFSTLCLVYPYMPLGSLDKHLDKLELGGRERIQVIQDITSGLHYLHTGCGEKLVHRDVKSANILLDQNWHGVLTDFGVARTLSLEATTIVTQRIVGTQVYMAPEYCTGLVSPAADVFSLGMVILELLFGCLAVRNPKGEDTDLLSFLDEYEEDTSDLYLSCWAKEEGKRLESLAERCTDINRHARPTMEKVLREL